MLYVGQKSDPISFAIYPDEFGNSATTLYEDDGLSPAYKQGAFRRTTIEGKQQGGRYVITLKAPAGSFNPLSRRFIFSVNSEKGKSKAVTVNDNGSARTVEIQ
jgi:alpha-D-xyloside xylohydrolase